MKDPALWELDDLNELIRSQAEESITLEFKRADSLEDLANRQSAERRKEEISKDVSAFANRTGGIIIYGIEEDKDEPHPAKALSPVIPAKCSKERLEQIITSRIKPPIQNLVIRPVKVSADGYVYVVKIPASYTAHQSWDKRYYRRVNFGNQMMDDDEIRQAMNRETKPTYHVKLTATLMGTTDIFISGSVQNTSIMIGHDVSAVLLLPNELARNTVAGTEIVDGTIRVRMLDDYLRRAASQLKPFEEMVICFERACRIPEEIPSFTVPLLIRVYDRFGHAHEAEFIMSLHPDSPGRIVSERQFGRDA